VTEHDPSTPPAYDWQQRQAPPPGYWPQPPFAQPHAQPPYAQQAYPPQLPPQYDSRLWAGGPRQPSATPPRRGRVRRILTARATGWVVAALLGATVAGLAVDMATTPAPAAARTNFPGGFARGGGGFPGFSGAFGTVDHVSSAGFTMTTRSGSTMTVKETASTTYRDGATAASASAVEAGVRVVVEGATAGATMTATEVIVLPAGGFGGTSGSG
jgi:hypothetical protein